MLLIAALLPSLVWGQATMFMPPTPPPEPLVPLPPLPPVLPAEDCSRPLFITPPSANEVFTFRFPAASCVATVVAHPGYRMLVELTDVMLPPSPFECENGAARLYDEVLGELRLIKTVCKLSNTSGAIITEGNVLVMSSQTAVPTTNSGFSMQVQLMAKHAYVGPSPPSSYMTSNYALPPPPKSQYSFGNIDRTNMYLIPLANGEISPKIPGPNSLPSPPTTFASFANNRFPSPTFSNLPSTSQTYFPPQPPSNSYQAPLPSSTYGPPPGNAYGPPPDNSYGSTGNSYGSNPGPSIPYNPSPDPNESDNSYSSPYNFNTNNTDNFKYPPFGSADSTNNEHGPQTSYGAPSSSNTYRPPGNTGPSYGGYGNPQPSMYNYNRPHGQYQGPMTYNWLDCNRTQWAPLTQNYAPGFSKSSTFFRF